MNFPQLLRDRLAVKRSLRVRQRDEKDCGPACLCAVCEYYGLHLSLAKARQLAGTDMQGTNMLGLVQAAEVLGFEAVPLAGDSDQLEEACSAGEVIFPAIAHTITPEGMQHYVVVLNVGQNRILLADPAVGKRSMDKALFYSQWTGVLVCLKKKGELCGGFETIKPLALLMRLIKGNKAVIVAALVMSLLLTGAGIASAFIFQLIIDDVVMRLTSVDTAILISSLTEICAIVVLIYVIQAILTSARSYCVASFAKKLDTNVMMGFYQRLVFLPLSFFGTRKTGEILSRFGDAAKIRDAVSSVALSAIIDCVLIIVGVVVLFAISWHLAMVALILFCLYFAVMFLCARRLEDGNRKLMEDNAQLQSCLKESIDGIETVKTFGQESAAFEKAVSLFEAAINQNFRLSLLVANQGAIVGLLYSLATVAILWLGVSEIVGGNMTLGALITFNALVGFFMEPVQRVVGLQPEIQSALIALQRLNDVNDLDLEDVENGNDDVDMFQPIEFDNVDFRYGARELVFSGINLSISPGEKIALVGESGSGKTTLAKLLLGFFSPEKGSIAIGGVYINDISRKYLRNNISYLSQEPFLFCGTIRDNIRFGNMEATDEDFRRVCDMCKITEFIERMGVGLDFMIEEGGGNLSGGQRQRIALARVMLRNPRILILDEATSNLDSLTESAIVENIFRATRGMTCILIAHRLSTIAACDRIMLLEHGAITEEGAHDDLLAKSGSYARYWEAQTGLKAATSRCSENRERRRRL